VTRTVNCTAPVFESIVPGLLSMNPFQVSPDLPKYGLPLGITKSGPFYYNPAMWQALQLITSPGIVIMGEKDCGKSSLAKLLAYLHRYLHVRPNDPTSRLTRAWIDDSKAAEWASLARYYDSEPFVVAKARLNPLDRTMDLGDQEFLVARILEQVSGAPLSQAGRNVLSGALQAIVDRNMPPSLYKMAEILSNPELVLPPRIYEGASERVYVDPVDFKADISQVSMQLSNMLRGPYGKVFGSETDKSVYASLSQQMISADYSGADEDVIRIMQMLFWMWKKKASLAKSESMVDLNIYDETYALLRHIEFTRPLSDAIKKMRENASTVVLITHAIRDYASIPGEAGRLSLDLLRDMPVWFVGRMIADDAHDVQNHFGCSNAVRHAITRLPPGTFMVFIGELEPFAVKILPTEKALSMTFSNQALKERVGEKVKVF
jgi:energy-coupling factor transporter ATP-binding protein EcfA2